MRWPLVLTISLVAALMIAGCTESYNQTDTQVPDETPKETANEKQVVTETKQYTAEQAFYLFKDPNEGAFTVEIPKGWEVTAGSGLVRPYIDAGISLEAKSQQNQGIYYSSPYGYIYVTPNNVLDMAGFKEGSQYDPSGTLPRPMKILKYMEAKDYIYEILRDMRINAEVKEVADRPDLLKNSPSPLITKQSAIEITYTDKSTQLKHKGILYIYLIEMSGTGVWAASYFDYYAPEDKFEETELSVLKIKQSFKVDPQWAIKEMQEVAKRTKIISQSQEDITATMGSSFEYKSKSMDETMDKWSNTMLQTEDVYNPDTGDHYVVDSGSKYYWVDDRNNIYGTETDQPPSYQENFKKMNCPNCNQ
jgi:hypothetical protein